MKRRLLELQDRGQLVISSLNTTQIFQAIKVFEVLQTIERNIHFLQKLKLSYPLHSQINTCSAGNRLWVQVNSLKAKVDPHALLPKSPKCCFISSCSYSAEMMIASVSDYSSTMGGAKLVV